MNQVVNSRDRVYNLNGSITFQKTRDKWGFFSTMAETPLTVNDMTVSSAEVLFQICRYPHLIGRQRQIAKSTSPAIARTKAYRGSMVDQRPDFLKVQVACMRWANQVKLIQHWDRFSDMLVRTASMPIVEVSFKDDFWATIPQEGNRFKGQNIRGRLLMELAEGLRNDPESMKVVHPPPLDNFRINGRDVPVLIKSP